MTPLELAPYIDHTLLKPETTRVQVEKLCQEALEYSLYAVCVNPRFVQTCRQHLSKSSVKIASVVGFPLGASTTRTKIQEAEEAVLHGAHEIDMVIWLGGVKSAEWGEVEADIRGVVQAVPPAMVKVIIETGLLSKEEKIKACEVSVRAGAHFVKTSTGFNGGGATAEDVKLMKSLVGQKAQVKASGGIKDFKTALAMIQAGASRIGTSSGVQLITQGTASGSY